MSTPAQTHYATVSSTTVANLTVADLHKLVRWIQSVKHNETDTIGQVVGSNATL